jgi:hypothetical protein
MGVLAFGLSTPRPLAIACGVLVAAWGPLQIAIYLKVIANFSSSLFVEIFFKFMMCIQWPEYFDHKEKYNPEKQ